jgi:hypothetical protein
MKPRPKGRGLTLANLRAYLIPVVIAPMFLIPSATRIGAMTPGPVVLVIIIVPMGNPQKRAVEPSPYPRGQ